jgi:hypothetical protein
MKTLVIGKPVTPTDNPTSKFQLTAEFNNEYGGNGEIVKLSTNQEQIIQIAGLYQSYRDGLKANWNKYCNCDDDIMNELAENAGDIELCEVWTSDNGGEYNMLEDFWIVWFDENGIEYEVSIKEEER